MRFTWKQILQIFKKKQISEIIEGWNNWIFETEEIKQVAEKRLNICLTCPFRSDIEKSPDKILSNSYCTACGCTLEKKTRCLKCPCPKEKWMPHEG